MRLVEKRIVSLPDNQWLAVLAEAIQLSVLTRLYEGRCPRRKRLKKLEHALTVKRLFLFLHSALVALMSCLTSWTS